MQDRIHNATKPNHIRNALKRYLTVGNGAKCVDFGNEWIDTQKAKWPAHKHWASFYRDLFRVLLLLSHFSCAISFSNAWKWKWSRSVVSDSSRSHGPQPTRLLRPWDFPGKSTGVGCHCLLRSWSLFFRLVATNLMSVSMSSFVSIPHINEIVWGIFLVFQWLRIYLPMQGTRVHSLIRELRSHVPRGQLSLCLEMWACRWQERPGTAQN